MKRTSKDIMLEILQLLEIRDCRKTSIVYKLNLNFDSAKEHLDFLIGKGYVKYDALYRYYSITPEGIIAVKKLEQAEAIFK